MTNRSWLDASPRAVGHLNRVIRSGALGGNIEYLAGRSVGVARASGPQHDSQTGVIETLGSDCLPLLSAIFGEMTLIESMHDGRGGPEAEALIRLRSEAAQGVLILSRLRPLGDRIEVRGDSGSIQFDVRRGKLSADPPRLLNEEATGRSNEPSRHTGDLLREIRAGATILHHPWELPAARKFDGLRGKRIFVTGGTGFIGARLVERLAENAAEVTAAVRDPRKAARIARLGIDLAVVSESSELPALLRGHDAVVNLAHDFNAAPEQNKALAFAVADACETARVPLLVQASSIAVYDGWPGAALDEDSPCDAPGHPYKEVKRAIERDLLERQKAGRLRTVLLQPTIVYGAFSKLWTDRFAERFRIGDVAVPAEGLCEGIHVDDLVDAIMAALVRSESRGRYIVSGPAPFAWSEMFAAFSGACSGWGELRIEPPKPAMAVAARGAGRLPPGALATLRARLAGLAGSSLRRRMGEERIEHLRTILLKAAARGRRPLFRPAVESPRLFANPEAVSTAKMRRDLIEPIIGIEKGAELVRSYLRWRYCPFGEWAGRGR